MVNVTNRANVHMRLVPLEFTFCHLDASLLSKYGGQPKAWAGLRSRLELSPGMRKRNCCKRRQARHSRPMW
jgi:hypothetical protein